MKETLDLSLRVNSEWANFYSGMAYPGSQFTQWLKIRNGHFQMILMVLVGLVTLNIHMRPTIKNEHIKGSEVLS